MNIIRYSRPFSLTIEAIEALCVGRGDIRSRLLNIDSEFFVLKPNDFPDVEDLRDTVKRLQKTACQLEPKKDEGRLKATFERSQLKTLEGIAQDIWSIYYEFNQYMNNS